MEGSPIQNADVLPLPTCLLTYLRAHTQLMIASGLLAQRRRQTRYASASRVQVGRNESLKARA